ncbi:MAG: T9SS type A sorting domain-containing protein [Flavobacteriales bacterium]
MKKFYFLFTLIFICSYLNAQILYSEDFSDGMPAEIMLYNLDGLTPDDPDLSTLADSARTVRTVTAQGFTGGNAAFSVSWYQGDEGPSDDWMVLPAVTLGTDPYLTWTGLAITSSGLFRDQYQIFISTGGNAIEDYILLSPEFDTGNLGEEPTPTIHQMSLADYSGETVNVAFRNWTQPYNPDLPDGPGNGGNELAIDDIFISNGPVSVDELQPTSITALVYPNPNQGSFTLNVNNQKRDTFTLRITDSLGRIVKDEKIAANQLTYQLEYAFDLEAGIYNLSLIADKEIVSLSLVIE